MQRWQVYAVLPAATLYLVYYNALSSGLQRLDEPPPAAADAAATAGGCPPRRRWLDGSRALYYATALPFFAFFAFFAAVLYPARDAIHPPPGAPPPWLLGAAIARGVRGLESLEVMSRRAR